jgi:hypothetical protein
MDEANITIHMIYGYILFALVIIQTITGVLQNIIIYQKRIQAAWIYKFNFIHKYIGVILTITSYISVLTGFKRGWNSVM